jgi:hypothetical protein
MARHRSTCSERLPLENPEPRPLEIRWRTGPAWSSAAGANRATALILSSAVWSVVEAWATSQDDDLGPYLDRSPEIVTRLVGEH